ncbi:MAG: HutP family protein [Eubacteriales bacterium]|jgi:hypothetical protein
MEQIGSREVASGALKMAASISREEEKHMKSILLEMGIKSCAVDFGGDLLTSANKLIERAVVSAKREGLIQSCHREEGAVAGCTREAIQQIITKAIGFNVGGKIGIARYQDHICVAMFFGVGLLHLNEISVGLGHRAI